MDEGAILYFGGYRKPEAGDFIRVYRHDQCVGWIHWTLKSDPITKECSDFLWCYAFGAAGRPSPAYSLQGAKDEITEAFLQHMDRLGCKVEGMSRKPKQEDVNWVETLLAELPECKTSKEVDSFVYVRNVRRLKEMPKYERTQVTTAAQKLRDELWAKENPEPELEER
jgi:hypothetical protein